MSNSNRNCNKHCTTGRNCYTHIVPYFTMIGVTPHPNKPWPLVFILSRCAYWGD